MISVSGHPLGADPAVGQPGSAREAINEMLEAGLLDELMDRVDAGGLTLTGEGGFLPEMVKAVLERGLAAELTEHLGYEKGDPAGRGSPNSRNGTTPKTLATEVGDVPLDVPRDRAGTFEPRLVPKGARRAGGLDEMIISLYAGGMTVRDIGHHLARTLGTELSHDTISKITDAVLEEVKAWQSRPLEEIYPIIYLDALVVKVRDGHQVRNKAAHIAVGVDLDGVKHVLGIWVQATEGAKFWAGVCAELRNRGVRDVLIVCCDGLTGFPEASRRPGRRPPCRPARCIMPTSGLCRCRSGSVAGRVLGWRGRHNPAARFDAGSLRLLRGARHGQGDAVDRAGTAGALRCRISPRSCWGRATPEVRRSSTSVSLPIWTLVAGRGSDLRT